MTGIDHVHEWLPLPDLADRLGIDVGRARQLVQDRTVVGTKRGERSIFSVPALFLVPARLANPANQLPAHEVGGQDAHEVVVSSLPGTISVLTDNGFSDEEIIEWLFEVEPAMGVAPIEALREGRKSEVRRIAQALT